VQTQLLATLIIDQMAKQRFNPSRGLIGLAKMSASD
jgi:hypothetical protein